MVISDRALRSLGAYREGEESPLVLAAPPQSSPSMGVWIAAGVAAGVITWAITTWLSKAFR